MEKRSLFTFISQKKLLLENLFYQKDPVFLIWTKCFLKTYGLEKFSGAGSRIFVLLAG